MNEINLKPVDNQTAEYIINKCWNDLYLRYSEYDNFNDKTWDDILGFVDETGTFQAGLIDRLYNEMPCEFTSNICMAILKELEARDRGEYIDIYHGNDVFKESHILSKVNALTDIENCWL
ncbi:MAG: hypothetical protein J6I76_16550 [Oribacterium sp.]|nr:hypothetical protein [Oribacterium sp.]